MPRQLNLRQIEAFKAVMELGTISRAAETLNISQPAMSKLVAHLEADTGLQLFDRVKGRLAPTEHATRLHEEVGRIFAGVRQVESAIEALRREKQRRLMIGAMPALAGSFIQRTTTGFLGKHGHVFCSIVPISSQWIVERLVTRSLDVGVVSATIENPYVTLEPLMEHPLVCVMPTGHPLARKGRVEPKDLDGAPFVGFGEDSHAGKRVTQMFLEHAVQAQIMLVAGSAQTVCEFVAAGLGVSLVHPLMVSGFERRLTVRPFVPEVLYGFQIGRNLESRNASLVEAYIRELRTTAAQISEAIVNAR
jgi:DNA-binding transcriptional LysR family regulator